MNFRDFLEAKLSENELSEAKLKETFPVIINNKEYTIKRHAHVQASRAGSKFGRDSGMSINKYTKVLDKGLPNVKHKTKESFTITWEANGKSFAISAEFIDKSTIMIFGAIMKSKKKPETLYRAKGTNRYHIGILTF